MKNCGNCGASLEDNVQWCTKCGEYVCKSCGAYLKLGIKRCPDCNAITDWGLESGPRAVWAYMFGFIFWFGLLAWLLVSILRSC